MCPSRFCPAWLRARARRVLSSWFCGAHDRRAARAATHVGWQALCQKSLMLRDRVGFVRAAKRGATVPCDFEVSSVLCVRSCVSVGGKCHSPSLVPTETQGDTVHTGHTWAGRRWAGTPPPPPRPPDYFCPRRGIDPASGHPRAQKPPSGRGPVPHRVVRGRWAPPGGTGSEGREVNANPPPPPSDQNSGLVDLHSRRGKGRAANGDRPVGADENNKPKATRQPPPPPDCTTNPHPPYDRTATTQHSTPPITMHRWGSDPARGHPGAQKPPLRAGPPTAGMGCPLGCTWPTARAVALLCVDPTQSSETGNLPRERKGE